MTGVNLAEFNFRYILTASRNCPHCGKRVIEENPRAS